MSAPTTEPADVALRRRLAEEYAKCNLLRPLLPTRYETGQRLEYEITGVVPANTGRILAEVERFVGGGFAGQVYRVKLLEVHATDGPIAGLEVGGTYAIKILKPPSGFACLFRDFLYFLGYQSAFSAQVNPHGVRVGVLWQKLIRRAAAERFGRTNAICDTYATLYDSTLHSFGEINEWVTGRIWKFEVDDQLFDRWNFEGAPGDDINSGEYVHKKLFQDELVRLLHEMGAPELARQYEWWTCKSQPNALKRIGADATAERRPDGDRLSRRADVAAVPADEPGGLLADSTRLGQGPDRAVRSQRSAAVREVHRRTPRAVRRSSTGDRGAGPRRTLAAPSNA